MKNSPGGWLLHMVRSMRPAERAQLREDCTPKPGCFTPPLAASYIQALDLIDEEEELQPKCDHNFVGDSSGIGICSKCGEDDFYPK